MVEQNWMLLGPIEFTNGEEIIRDIVTAEAELIETTEGEFNIGFVDASDYEADNFVVLHSRSHEDEETGGSTNIMPPETALEIARSLTRAAYKAMGIRPNWGFVSSPYAAG